MAPSHKRLIHGQVSYSKKKRKKKLRSRVNDRIKAQKHREAVKKYNYKNPKVNREAVKIYKDENPDVNRASLSRYAKKKKSQSQSGYCSNIQ